ncbi:unnamed protein product [Macrosiphum euphorbiae]|uniref:Uncharacterized protein n=1 Tax=Macrosiphum euphorbiae TaxID=13131 RepID=A0AAV0VII6_9HEMI|nr:unnamed protein product [Macrosiphum euphorbiae]
MYSVTITLCLCLCILSESMGGLVVMSRVPPDPRKKFKIVSQLQLRGPEYNMAADQKVKSSPPPPICDCSHVSEYPHPQVVGSQVTSRRPQYIDDPKVNGYRPPHIGYSKVTGYRPSASTNCPTQCPPRCTMPPWPTRRTPPPCTTYRTMQPPCTTCWTLPPCTTCRTKLPCTTCRTLPPCDECRTKKHPPVLVVNVKINLPQ